MINMSVFKKVIPYVKWLLAITGLYYAITSSIDIQNVYVERDYIKYISENNVEQSPIIREELRKASIKSAGNDLMILVFGIMASCFWLSLPKTKTTKT